MRSRYMLAAAAAFTSALGTGVADAQTTTYRLDSGTLLDGCQLPCTCEVDDLGDVQGTLLLREQAATATRQTFSVENVNWTVVAPDGGRTPVTGEGSYTIDSSQIFPFTRLVLTLSIGGGPADEFDSGDVPSLAPLDLSLSIADNDFFCDNRIFILRGTAVPPEEVLTHELVGTTLQEGCFPPCLCPISDPQRVFGELDLVLLGTDGTLTEYAVSAVRWRTGPTTYADTRSRVRGYGTYTVLTGAGSPVEDLVLCLTFAGTEADPFRSGPTADAGGPGIDLVLTQHDLVCLDRILDLHAVPR